MRAAFTARLGMPLTGQMLHSNLPFYPSLTVIEGETYIHKQIQQNLQEQAAPPSATVGSRQHPAAAAAVYHTAAPITDTQVAHARLQKAGHHRPLGSMFPLCFHRSSYHARALFQWTMVSPEKSDSGNEAELTEISRPKFSEGPFPLET